MLAVLQSSSAMFSGGSTISATASGKNNVINSSQILSGSLAGQQRSSVDVVTLSGKAQNAGGLKPEKFPPNLLEQDFPANQLKKGEFPPNYLKKNKEFPPDLLKQEFPPNPLKKGKGNDFPENLLKQEFPPNPLKKAEFPPNILKESGKEFPPDLLKQEFPPNPLKEKGVGQTKAGFQGNIQTENPSQVGVERQAIKAYSSNA